MSKSTNTLISCFFPSNILEWNTSSPFASSPNRNSSSICRYISGRDLGVPLSLRAVWNGSFLIRTNSLLIRPTMGASSSGWMSEIRTATSLRMAVETNARFPIPSSSSPSIFPKANSSSPSKGSLLLNTSSRKVWEGCFCFSSGIWKICFALPFPLFRSRFLKSCFCAWGATRFRYSSFCRFLSISFFP